MSVILRRTAGGGPTKDLATLAADCYQPVPWEILRGASRAAQNDNEGAAPGGGSLGLP